MLSTDSCDYGQLISEFLGESCMPGAKNSVRHAQSSQEYIEKVCSLCKPTPRGSKYFFLSIFKLINSLSQLFILVAAVTCNADLTNEYYNDDGALRCLEVGDFAVITKKGNKNFLK